MMRIHRGFSPIETVIVLLIIGILTSIIYNRYYIYKREAYNVALKYDLTTLKTVITLYKIKNDQYPDNLSQLITPGYLLDEKNSFILAVIKYKNGKMFINQSQIIYDNKTGKVYISN